METTIFTIIADSIASIGIANTLLAIILTIGIGWIYKNEKKQKKILESTVDIQNRTILEAINAQNNVLYEIQRISLNVAELSSQQNGRLDSMIEIVVSFMNNYNDRNNNNGNNNSNKAEFVKGGL